MTAPFIAPKMAPTPTPWGQTPFTQQQNLIGTQFNPGAPDPNNLLGQAQGFITNAGLGAQSPDVTQARQQTMQSLAALGNAPNRSDIASNLYSALSKQDTANLGKDIQGLGQRAASLGRLGSGMVTSEAGDIFGQHEANLAAIRANLAANTAGQEQGDLLNRLGATQGVAQGLGGLDLQRNQLGSNIGLNQAEALQGLQGQQYGQGLGNLGFLQQERGYQQGEEQRSIGNALQQYLTQQGAQGQAFGQQQDQANALGQYGFNLENPLANLIAQQYGEQGQSTIGGAGDLLRLLFQNQQAPTAQMMTPSAPQSQ